MEIKANVNKWDLIKLKSFCTMKETISKVKRQPSEWDKIIANEETDKGLISKIYKQFLQLNSRKINAPIKKWAKELNRHFSKEDIQMLSKTLQAINVGEVVEKRELSFTLGRTQQSHYWASTQRKPELKETRVPQCSLQHCL